MGTVTLISNVWDYIANVEVREGNLSTPENNRLVYSGPVARGTWFRSSEGVTQFYRRSNDPSDPTSKLGGWSSNARTISGNDDWSLD